MPEDRPAVEAVSTRTVYANAWMTVREDSVRRADGSEGIYAVVDKPDFALIIPAENDGFHLVEQYRYPIGRRSWEFPQGTFSGRRVGDPEELARAELAEETGLTAGHWEYLGRHYCAAGMANQAGHVFVATDLRPGRPNREASEQDMRQTWVPRKRWERMIASGEVVDDSSIAAYALYLLRSCP